MLDLEKLEAAGFEKTMTAEEWEEFHEHEQERYKRRAESSGQIDDMVATGTVTKNYVLKRGPVLIITEQNTQTTTASGLPAMITYPEIVIVKSEKDGRQIACSPDDTDLILALADELSMNPSAAQHKRADQALSQRRRAT